MTDGSGMPDGDARQAVPVALRVLHSAVPGRVRVHCGGLQGSAALGGLVERGLRAAPGVRSASASALTGNVVVEFDPALPPSHVTDRIAALLRREIVPPEEDEDDDQTAYRRAARQVAAELGTSPAAGLSDAEAAGRLARFGRNALPVLPARSDLAILFGQFQNAPTVLLAGAAALSVVTGGVLDAAAIASVVALNGLIGYLTESRAERTIRQLSLPGPQTAHVIRGGAARDVPAEFLVPGDVIVLQRGAVVPADARLLAVHGLSVAQAALTGESAPVAKETAALEASGIPLGSRTNMVYRGTAVTGGSATAVVVATGRRTEIGRIQRLVGTAVRPETPLERQLGGLGRQIAWVALGAGGLIFGIGWLRGFALLQLLRSALSTAVAAVPEGLPTVATWTLALGVEDMRRRQVLVRRLNAVETLAAVEVVCFDKTGTLTFNDMAIEAVSFGDGLLDIRDRMPPQLGDADSPVTPARLERLYEIGALCSETELEARPDGTVLHGSATENALVRAALAAGLDVAALRARHPRLAVQQRSEAYRFMASTHAAGDRIFVAVKGSPLEVLARCDREDGPDGLTRALTAERRAEIERINGRMADRALRVLGFAYKYADGPRSAPRNGAVDDLIWVGLAGMADPVRPGLPETMAALHRAGIHTVVMTGDQSATARAVAEQLGLGAGRDIEVVDSAEIEHWPPERLAAAARRAHVFARVSPAQKLAIVRALQQAGTVVAMVGDGINDSPALRAANIGFTLGRSSTEAAREAADVLLETDDLGALVVAVEQGRTIYTNIRKSVRYLLATNSSEILVMLAGIALGFGEVLSPMQLLWINLISDVLPGLGLALEPPEPDVMRQAPRPADERLMGRADFGPLAGEAAVLGGGALAAYACGALRFGAGSPEARTMAFGSLVVSQLLHALSCRSPAHGAFASGNLPANPHLSNMLRLSLAAQLGAFLIPGLRGLLGIAPIGPIETLVTLVGGTVPFLAIEELKASRRQTFRGRTARPEAATRGP